MDMQTTDEAMLHAQRQVIKALTKFFLKFFGSRIPTSEELVSMFGVTPDEAAQVTFLMDGEGEGA